MIYNYYSRIFTLFLLACPFLVNAQVARVDFLSPQTADFVKYGGPQPSFYTGQIGLNIPLIEAKDNIFNVPVSLSYNSAGFMPGRPSGPVGLNWHLAVGGAITRKVNGVPDDSKGDDIDHVNYPYGTNNEKLRGFHHGVNTFGPRSKNDMFNFTIGAPNPYLNVWYMGYDTEPDEFSFNFMGHSGKFFIKNDGTVKVLSEEHLIVDLSGFASQEAELANITYNLNESEISITTADGYQFYFGGALKNLEYSYTIGEGSTINHFTAITPVINTWNLTKVISPAGKELLFNYKDHNPGIDALNVPLDANHWILNHNSEELQTYGFATAVLLGTFVANTTNSMTFQTTWSITKTCYLESVVSDNFEINFLYSQKANKFYANAGLAGIAWEFDQRNLKLDEVNYKNLNQTLIKKINFSYGYDNTSTRLKLNSLTEYGKNPYLFDYNDEVSMPVPEIRGIDHWGYWNGGTSTTSRLIPELNLFGYGDETIVGSARNSNPVFSKIGLLKKITYPTRGYSTFEYEGNTYAKRLQRTEASAFLPGINNQAGDAGGVRIKTITDYNGQGIENVREFKYLKDYIINPASTTSSGFLLDYPKYSAYWEAEATGGGRSYVAKLRSSSYHNNYNTSENFINYSEVTEVTNGIGYRVYKFSNYESNPDVMGYNEHFLGTVMGVDPNYWNIYKNYVGFKFNDRSEERGKIIFTGIYNSDRGLVQSTTNTYKPFSLSSNNYSVSVFSSGSWAQAFKIYEDMHPLKTIESTLVNNGRSVTTTQSLEYDTYGQVYEKTTSTSKADILKTQYRYPYNMLSTEDTYSVYPAMVAAHQIARVTEEKNSRGTNQISLAQTVYYSPAPNVYLPKLSKVQKSATDPIETTAVYTHAGVSDYQIETIKTNNSFVKSYIWGHYKQHPIAEVVGSPTATQTANFADIAFTSFEPGAAGNWTIPSGLRSNVSSRTGNYSYSLSNGAVSKSSLNTSTVYTVSYWSNQPTPYAITGTVGAAIAGLSSRGWTLYTHKVTGQTTISVSGSGAIDALSLHPSEAMITTYTYEPLVGITSITDTRHKTTYYQYDQYQRLINIRDQDGNILKNYQYHYKP